jgi:hypothetical protein
MLEQTKEYSINKHVKNRVNNWIIIQCPMKFSVPENGVECIQEKCAWFMPVQKACAINVLARIKY